MPDENRGYNGWTNYATWCVKLWIDNEEPSAKLWREIALNYKRNPPAPSYPEQTDEQAACYALAKRLESHYETRTPLHGANVYTDLLGHALGSVNWHEIAKSMLEDL